MFIGQRHRVGTRLLVTCELSGTSGFAPNMLPTKSSGCCCAKVRREPTKGCSAMRGRLEVRPPGHRGSRSVVSLSPKNQIPFEDLATVVRRGLQP